MVKKELGKIRKVIFGFGGYQDCQFGLYVELETGGGGMVGDFKGNWGPKIKWDKHCKWNEGDRNTWYAETMEYVGNLLVQAKVDDVCNLRGIPVEVTFVGNCLKSWRILTEVL